jgi:hypothetical protein
MNMDKMKMRRMALDKMMAEGPSIVSKMKKADPMDEMEDMEGEESQKGFVQMAVTPAEKEMIMAARKNAKPSEGMEDESDESMEEMA